MSYKILLFLLWACLSITSCGGGSGGGSSNDLDVASETENAEQNGSEDPVESDNIPDITSPESNSTIASFPFSMNTGFILASLDFVEGTQSSGTTTFSTDTSANLITIENPPFNLGAYNTIRYDNLGRVTELFSSFGDKRELVSYNDDGSVAKIETSADSTFGNKSRTIYSYVEGRLVLHNEQRNIEDSGSFTIIEYDYDENGRLLRSRQLNFSGDRLNTGSDYNYNIDGRIDETLQIFDQSTTNPSLPSAPAVRSRKSIVYDDHGNIIRMERFDESGGLSASYNFTYVQSDEPTPNLTGFFSMTNRFLRLF